MEDGTVDMSEQYEELKRKNLELIEFSNIHTTIPDDVRKLLRDSNPKQDLDMNPYLTLIVITNLYARNPCNQCQSTIDVVMRWAGNHDLFKGKLRPILVDSVNGFDEKHLWDKIHANFNEVPVLYFFDENQSLIDVIKGAPTYEYLEIFWTSYFDKFAI